MDHYNWHARTRVRYGRHNWRKHWQIVRQVGWARYVLVDHGLIYGVSLFLLSILFERLFHFVSPPSSLYPMLMNALIFFAAWCALGAAQWWNLERHYHQPKKLPKEPVS